jgi:hypothetical protein
LQVKEFLDIHRRKVKAEARTVTSTARSSSGRASKRQISEMVFDINTFRPNGPVDSDKTAQQRLDELVHRNNFMHSGEVDEAVYLYQFRLTYYSRFF